MMADDVFCLITLDALRPRIPADDKTIFVKHKERVICNCINQQLELLHFRQLGKLGHFGFGSKGAAGVSPRGLAISCLERLGVIISCHDTSFNRTGDCPGTDLTTSAAKRLRERND